MDLKEFLREKKWKKMKKDQWLILFLAGVLLLVVAMPTGKSSSKTVKQQNAFAASFHKFSSKFPTSSST